MRVTLETKPHDYTQGLVFKRSVTRHRVYVKVELTPEETAVVEKQNLRKKALYSSPTRYDPKHEEWIAKNPSLGPLPHQLTTTYPLGAFLSGVHFEFDHPIEASNFETHLREKLLPMIKNLVTRGPGPKTFEM